MGQRNGDRIIHVRSHTSRLSLSEDPSVFRRTFSLTGALSIVRFLARSASGALYGSSPLESTEASSRRIFLYNDQTLSRSTLGWIWLSCCKVDSVILRTSKRSRQA